MAASRHRATAVLAVLSRRWWALAVAVVSMSLVFACWWLTAPLVDSTGASDEERASAAPVALSPAFQARAALDAPIAWPERRLEGDDAKRRLLDILAHAAERLNRVGGYTATFRKQERIKGALGPAQTLEMKVRHRPFAVYLKFLEPQKGKEVVYAEGRHENKVIAHGGGFTRLLVPRLAVAPDHPLALADSRHPVTEAGLANLTSKLLRFRQLDLVDPEAETVLDQVTDKRGRLRCRSVHSHPNYHADRPFARVVVLYDPTSFFPIDIQSYDWPDQKEAGALQLAEHYSYDEIRCDAPLTALDFDPANPSYAFHRY